MPNFQTVFFSVLLLTLVSEGGEELAQLIKHLLQKHERLSSNPPHHVNAERVQRLLCNARAREVETGNSQGKLAR